MAKTDDPSWIERHVEKALLGATAVALVVVLLFWVISSPRKIKLDGSSKLDTPSEVAVSPERADAELEKRRENLEKLLKRLDKALSNTSAMTDQQLKDLLREYALVNPRLKPPDYPQLLQNQFRTPCDSSVHDLVQFVAGARSSTTVTTPLPAGRPELANLLPLPAPKAPVVNVVDEVAAIPQQDGRGGFRHVETFTVHGAAVFPFGEMLEKWRQALAKAGIQPSLTFYAVRAECRQRTPGGQWSDVRPVSFARLNKSALPALPEKFDGGDVAVLRRDIAEVAKYMQEILEPEYYQIFADGRYQSWLRGKPRTPVSELLARPAQPDQPARPAAPVRPEQPTRPRPTPRFPRGIPEEELPPGMYEDLTLPPGGPSRYPSPTPTRRTPTRIPRMPDRMPPGDAVFPGAVPAMHQQLAGDEGILEIWFHEMFLAPQTEYIYRVQLVLVSPMAGMGPQLASPDDAKVVLLTTPWSPWSDPASAPGLTQFFVTGGTSHLEGYVMVDVFTKKLGQTIQTRLKLRSGQPIKGSVMANVVQADGQTKLEKVDYDTGAVAVDFSEVKRPRLRGFDYDSGTTIELVYLDADGKLRARTEAADEASPLYDKLKKEVAPPAPGGGEQPER